MNMEYSDKLTVGHIYTISRRDADWYLVKENNQCNCYEAHCFTPVATITRNLVTATLP